MVHNYWAYGLHISSEWLLPELIEYDSARHGGDGTADLVIRRGKTADPAPILNGAPRHADVRDNKATLHFKHAGTFHILEGREIVACPLAGQEDRVTRLFILGASLGVILHQRGNLVLHASAVEVEGQTVAFMGKKGHGKSTTAATLHARGYPLLSDDLVPVRMRADGPPETYMGFPQLKLWPDAVEASIKEDPVKLDRLHPQVDKRRHQVDTSCDGRKFPIRAIYVLDGGSQLELESISRKEALWEIMRSSYAINFLGDEAVGPEHFQRSIGLVQGLPIKRLIRRNDIRELDKAIRILEADFLSI